MNITETASVPDSVSDSENAGSKAGNLPRSVVDLATEQMLRNYVATERATRSGRHHDAEGAAFAWLLWRRVILSAQKGTDIVQTVASLMAMRDKVDPTLAEAAAMTSAATTVITQITDTLQENPMSPEPPNPPKPRTPTAADTCIAEITAERDGLNTRLREAEERQVNIEARRHDNATLRGEITRADQKAGLLSAVVVPATGAAVATGIIAALPRYAEITGWSAAAAAAVIAALLVTVIRPRLADDGTVGAASTIRPDTTEAIVERLDTEHDELDAILGAKNRWLTRAFRLLSVPAALAVVALVLAGIGV